MGKFLKFSLILVMRFTNFCATIFNKKCFGTFILLLVTFGSAPSFANSTQEFYSKQNLPPKLAEKISKDECRPNLIKFDVCKRVREVADNIAPQLPMKMSSTISLAQVTAIKTSLIFVVMLSYNKEYLETELRKKDITMEELMSNFKQGMSKLLCKADPSISGLIEIGAQIQYKYYFRDMTPYTVVTIDRTLCHF